MSLRIGGSSSYRSSRDVSDHVGREDTPDSYLERLVKLVPSEVIVAYPMLKGSAPADIASWAWPLTAWILLAVVIVLRWHATATTDRGPQWLAILLSAMSFIIWVNVIDGSFGVSNIASYLQVPLSDDWSPKPESQRFLSSMALVLWTVIVPVLYKGDDR